MARPSSTCPPFFARLYRDEGESEDLDLDRLDGAADDDTLLWVDLCDPDASAVERVWRQCRFPVDAQAFLDGGSTPAIGQDAAHFWVRCVVVNAAHDREVLSGTVLVCVAGANRVLTFRRAPVPFLEELREARNGRASLGHLSAESFVAMLLDRQLNTYFDAVSDFEMAIERLEVGILGRDDHCGLGNLQQMRRWSSRLRRMLAPHRAVFGGMSRPDFRPDETRSAERHFVALDTRFERAMDMVENARDLVIGSFELFSNQIALKTNEIMRVLTFVTVITGVLATIVGALGMNFRAALFETGGGGFAVAVGGLVLLAAGALLLGRWRRWF